METLKISKRGNYYLVKFDTGMELKLLEKTIIDFNLIKHKIQVSEEMLESILKRNEYYTCLNQGMKYLANIHSRKETFLHLNKKFPKEVCLEVVKKLIDLKFIDDLEYAKLYLNYAYKHLKGPNFVKTALYNEDIPKDIIEDVMPLYSFKMEEEACDKALNKQVLNYKKESYKSCLQKLNIFLKNRGFTEKVIALCIEKNKDVVDNIIDEEKLISKDYEKYFKSYSKKLSGKALDEKIKNALYRKGFSLAKINKFLESRDNCD